MGQIQKCGFAGGCFWGVEHAFKQIEGVVATTVGFQGGDTLDPSYKEVCNKKSGHAEVVQVEFDDSIVGLKRLLDAFFFMHDPTQLNAQGPDIGPQYRSALFPENDQQEREMRDYIQSLIDERKYTAPIVTSIESNKKFFPAEVEHQDYLAINPSGYCHIGFDIFSRLKMGNF